jgi:hypothetical protein
MLLMHQLQEKLDALPPDVRAVAWELAYVMRDAEREACAVAAEQYAAPRDPSIRYASQDEIVEMIAADIRKRT